MRYIETISKLHACSTAIVWMRKSGHETAQAAWDACDRGDWMLWLIGCAQQSAPWSDERKPIVLASCDCAELALPYAGRNTDLARACIETTRAWCRGEAKDEQLKDARRKAADAPYAAAAAYAAYADAYAAYADAAAAAYAAAAAAYAAYADAYAPYADAYDPYADAYAPYAAAANAAYADAARSKTLSACADIVRRHFPVCPVGDE